MQEEIVKVIQASNFLVSVTWRLREEFKAIFGCDLFPKTKKYFELWLASVKEMAIKEILRVTEMFERHVQGVRSALWQKQSNARAEQINGTIQAVKTVGGGYRKFENFRSASHFSAAA